jgi:hypothetical protein
MKKMMFIAIAFAMLFSAGNAQKNYTATKDLTLTFTSDEGTNGSAVVWDSERNIYYGVIAGNTSYPLEAFSKNGSPLFSSEAYIDVRGLWYNSKTKNLEGNGAGETGIFEIKTDATGMPESASVLIDGQFQPDFQSVGAFDSKKQLIYYFYDGMIHSYKRKNGKLAGSFEITNCPKEFEFINSSTLIFTGRKGEELGLLDIDRKVYLFDLKGKYRATIELPGDAITNDLFRFSYANDRIWLYDVDSRTWNGYTF